MATVSGYKANRVPVGRHPKRVVTCSTPVNNYSKASVDESRRQGSRTLGTKTLLNTPSLNQLSLKNGSIGSINVNSVISNDKLQGMKNHWGAEITGVLLKTSLVQEKVNKSQLLTDADYWVLSVVAARLEHNHDVSVMPVSELQQAANTQIDSITRTFSSAKINEKKEMRSVNFQSPKEELYALVDNAKLSSLLLSTGSQVTDANTKPVNKKIPGTLSETPDRLQQNHLDDDQFADDLADLVEVALDDPLDSPVDRNAASRAVTEAAASSRLSLRENIKLMRSNLSPQAAMNIVATMGTIAMGGWGSQSGVDGMDAGALETARVIGAKFGGRGLAVPLMLTMISKNKVVMSALAKKAPAWTSHLHENHKSYAFAALALCALHVVLQTWGAFEDKIPPGQFSEKGVDLIVSGVAWAMQMGVLAYTGAGLIGKKKGLPYAANLAVHAASVATQLPSVYTHVTNYSAQSGSASFSMVTHMLGSVIALGLVDMGARTMSSKPKDVLCYPLADNALVARVPIDNCSEVPVGSYINFSDGKGKPPHPITVAYTVPKEGHENNPKGPGYAVCVINTTQDHREERKNFTSRMMQDALKTGLKVEPLSAGGSFDRKISGQMSSRTPGKPVKSKLGRTTKLNISRPLTTGKFADVHKRKNVVLIGLGSGASEVSSALQAISKSDPAKPGHVDVILSMIADTKGSNGKVEEHNLAKFYVDRVVEFGDDYNQTGGSKNWNVDVHLTRGRESVPSSFPVVSRGNDLDRLESGTQQASAFELKYATKRPDFKAKLREAVDRMPRKKPKKVDDYLLVCLCGSDRPARVVAQAVKDINAENVKKGDPRQIQFRAETAGD